MKDADIIIEAMYYYTNNRLSFASAIAMNGYRKQDGTMPTVEEIREASVVAKRCEELLEELREIRDEDKD